MNQMSQDQEESQKKELHRDIEHLHGPAGIDYELDELVVVCLLRNGRPYIKSFVEHYLSLGAKHLFFLDNGSTDGTVEALEGYEAVTVLRSTLPFKHYQMVMKRYLMECFGGIGGGRWVLYVDIDELFEYPYSEIVGLGEFLGYLRERSYTAVVGQMLDMFPSESVEDREVIGDEPLKERHRFYDLSNVSTLSYGSLPIASGSGNVPADAKIELLRDGIQNTLFGGRSPLTKHPLVFMDGESRPMDGSSHSISGARIADLTCVILHYKFLDSLYGQLRRAAEEENYMKDSSKHKKQLAVLEQGSSLWVKRETASELRGTGELVGKGFINVSEEYMGLVEAESRKNGADEGELRQTLAGNLLDAQETIRNQNQSIRELESRVEELESTRRLAVRRQWRVNALEQENGALREKTQAYGAHGERERALREQAESLRSQLRRVRSSRTWIALDAINRLKLRLLGR